MGLEVVKNQTDLPLGIPDEPAHEDDELALSHRLAVDHEPYLPLIGNGGDHADMCPFRGHFKNRCYPLRSIAPDSVRLVLYTRFISPVDFCLFFFLPRGRSPDSLS